MASKRIKGWGVGVVCVAVLVFAGLWALDDLPDFPLPDGGKGRVLGAEVGPYRLEEVPVSRFERIVGRLPRKVREKIRSVAPTALPGGGNRSWMHVPNVTNVLQIYLRLDRSQLGSSGDLNQLSARIIDDDGWVWESHGRGSRTVNPDPMDRVDAVGVSFAAYPRWQREFEVELFTSGWSSYRKENSLGRFRLPNPVLSEPLPWEPKALPQESLIGPVTIVLESIEARTAKPDPSKAVVFSGLPFRLTFQSREPADQGPLTNSWHEVKKSFIDSFGNNSHSALPPRMAGDTAPETTWMIELELAGDHRSQYASNAWYGLTARKLPEAGAIWEDAPGTEGTPVPGMTVEKTWLAGRGVFEFTGGVLATNLSAVDDGAYLGINSSMGTSTDASGRNVRTYTLRSGEHFVAAKFAGLTDQTWLSCRAEDADTGKVLWLDGGRPASERPIFRRLFNDDDFTWWRTEGLDTNVTWRFVIGVHPTIRARFVVARPTVAAE